MDVGENCMKKSPKKLLDYLRERFRGTLINLKIDIVEKHRDHFAIGYPTFRHSGTGYYRVYSLRNGTICVKEDRRAHV